MDNSMVFKTWAMPICTTNRMDYLNTVVDYNKHNEGFLKDYTTEQYKKYTAELVLISITNNACKIYISNPKNVVDGTYLHNVYMYCFDNAIEVHLKVLYNIYIDEIYNIYQNEVDKYKIDPDKYDMIESFIINNIKRIGFEDYNKDQM